MDQDFHVLASKDNLVVSVGWARERGSYWATVLDRTQIAGDTVVVALGHKGSPAIKDPTVVIDAVRDYADIPDGLLQQLTDDASANQPEPTARPVSRAAPVHFSHREDELTGLGYGWSLAEDPAMGGITYPEFVAPGYGAPDPSPGL